MNAKKIYLKTFGCQMNEYDSGKIADIAKAAAGYEVTDDINEADLVVFNTCSIREKAQEKVFSDLGVNPEENENGQKFVIDIDYYVDMTKACHLDDIDDTVSYAKVVKTVNRVFTNAKYGLIEHCAQVIADGILNDFDAVYKVDVTVKKPQAPIKADFDYVSVSISRSRE